MQMQTETNGKSHAKDVAGELVLQLPVKDIVVKAQSRKTFTGLEELAKSIGEHGLIQPVLVRRNGSVLELVCGERRLRATKLAKLTTIAAIVRVMTDLQVLEIQLVENCQRQDVHPLEEAEAYDALHKKHGYKVEDIAAKVGKSAGHIYARLKLCALIPEARTAFFDGKIVTSVAFLIARIPNAEQQKAALKDCTRIDTWRNNEAPSYGECVRIVQDRYMLRLADAAFDRGDAKLVPSAGACISCPKRTGNQPELFGDVKSKDTCTDAACFRTKLDAHARQTLSKAKAKGREVLEPVQAREVLAHGTVTHSSGFVDVDDRNYSAKGSPKWKELLAKDVPRIVAVDPNSGKVHELVRRADVEKVKRGGGKKGAKSERSSEAKQREKDKRRKEMLAAGAAAVVAKAEAKDFATETWRALVVGMIGFAWAEVTVDVCKRRGIEAKKKHGCVQSHAALEAFAKKATPAELRGLAAELVCTRGNRYEIGAAMRGMLAALKIDLAKLTAKKA